MTLVIYLFIEIKDFFFFFFKSKIETASKQLYHIGSTGETKTLTDFQKLSPIDEIAPNFLNF